MISQVHSRWPAVRRGLAAAVLLGGLLAAEAVERELKIEAPASIRAGQDLQVKISAGTDAGNGEQVGFLQADSSIDGGKTWLALCYLQNTGPQAAQEVTLRTAPGMLAVQVRARVAFRDGLAGDVDFNGAAIRWQGSWNAWEAPPAKLANVKVVP
jgi:hypothetical protein